MDTPVRENYGVALYYPYIHIRNTNWLKASLLYWEKLRRIVPEEVPTEDSKDVRSVIDAGLLVDTSPADYILHTRNEFFESLYMEWDPKKIPSSGHYRRSIREATPPVPRIYVQKFAYDLYRALLDMGLAVEHGDQLVMDETLGGLYMTVLASEMSKMMKSPLVTDFQPTANIGQRIHYAGRFVAQEKPFKAPSLAKLEIDLPGPKGLSNVPMQKILEFHRKYGDERLRYRQSFEEIAGKLSEIQDPNAGVDYLESVKAQIQKAREDYLNAQRHFAIQSFGGLLNLSVPSMVSSMIAPIQLEPIRMILAACGIAFSVLQWRYGLSDQKRDIATGNPWHYLLLVQKSLSRSRKQQQ